MAFVVTYPAVLGPVCRAFTTRDKAVLWVRCVTEPRFATIRETDSVRFYVCRTYTRKLRLFPAGETIRCGLFINGRHFEQLMKLWSGPAGGKEGLHYEYVELTGEYDGIGDPINHCDHRPEFARPEFSVAS
jgi:hypothetical protein